MLIFFWFPKMTMWGMLHDLSGVAFFKCNYTLRLHRFICRLRLQLKVSLLFTSLDKNRNKDNEKYIVLSLKKCPVYITLQKDT